jgi:iron(III) transport system substrate-binding protein
VVVAGPPFPGLRNSLSEGFQRAYGVAVEYVTLPGGELMTRVDREAKAGTTSLDISIAGNVSCWTMGERGQLDNAREVVIDPGLYEPAVWRTGQPKFLAASPVMPPDFACGLQTAEWVMTDLFVNRDLIPPGTIQSWRDLLKPEYKGKIASFDPRRAGPAHTTVPYIYSQFGLDYLRDLYVGQDPALTTDNRQLAEWVARGTHPIGIALVQGAAEPFRAEGLPLERIFPADGPGSVTGGFSLIEKLKGGPNPNAGLVFLNWFASKDAQELYEREVMEMSLRADVSHQVPDYVMPKGGVSYLDSYDPTYYYPQMEGVDKLVALMGR